MSNIYYPPPDYEGPTEEEEREYYSRFPDYDPKHTHDTDIEVDGVKLQPTTYQAERDAMQVGLNWAADIVKRGGGNILLRLLGRG